MDLKNGLSYIIPFVLAFTLMCCGTDDGNNVDPNPLPTTFNQTAPASGSTVTSWSPTLSWETSTGATTYSLIVSTNSDYTDPYLEVESITETSHVPEKLLSGNTQYFWKITAHNENGSTVATNHGVAFTTPSEPSPGNTYHVTTTGSDDSGDGSATNPFKTLAYAATQVPASQNKFIYVHTGTFVETEPAIIPLGVNVIGDGEEKTIISSSGVTIPEGVDPEDPGYKERFEGSLIQLVSGGTTPGDGDQTLSGFTIDGNSKSLKAGVWAQNRSGVVMHHVTIRECNLRGALFSGGYKDYLGSPEVWLKKIKIYDCTFINSGKDLSDETLGNLCIGGLDGAEIYNITINDNEGYGIKFTLSGYYKNCKIHDCNITLNESDSKWGEDIAIELWEIGPGNEVYNIYCNTWLSFVSKPGRYDNPDGTENLKVHDVRMIDQDGNSRKEAIECGGPGFEIYNCYFENKGFGMAIWDNGFKNITIRNNVFYNTRIQTNFAAAGPIAILNSTGKKFTGIKIHNNVFHTFKNAIVINGVGKVSDVSIKNNVFLNVSGLDILNGIGASVAVNFDNNLKFTENKEADWKFESALTTNTNNIIGDPGFINTGDKWDTYYKPSSAGSLVVDKGVDVGISFNGAAPDIGRFEF